MKPIERSDADVLSGRLTLPVGGRDVSAPVLTIAEAKASAAVFVMVQFEDGMVMPVPVDLSRAVPA